MREGVTTASRTARTGASPHAVRRTLGFITLAWVFGAVFFAITTGAALIAFLRKYMQVDDFSYGLILAAGPAAVLFQFFGSYLVERTGRVKKYFLWFNGLHRFIWLGVAAVPLLLPDSSRALQIGVVGLIVFASAALANIGSPGWASWMSSLVPKSIAGKYFGWRAAIGFLVMCATTIVVAALLDRYPTAGWLYGMIFTIAALFGTIDILLFIPVREKTRPHTPAPPALRDLLVTPWRDALFRGFALYTALSGIAYTMMGPFVWTFCFDSHANNGMGMSLVTANLLLYIAPVLSMAVMGRSWGQAIDRFGPKPVLAASALANIIAPAAWIFMRPEFIWAVPIITIISGLTWPGIDQVQFYTQMKGFPATRQSTYVAMFAVVFGLASMTGSAVGGAWASFWQHHIADFQAWLPGGVSHYHPVFLTSILLRIAAFVFVFPTLRLPGSARYSAVARSLAGSVSSSVTRAYTSTKRK
jgi:MFS family permease